MGRNHMPLECAHLLKWQLNCKNKNCLPKPEITLKSERTVHEHSRGQICTQVEEKN